MQNSYLSRVLLIGASGRVGRMIAHGWKHVSHRVELVPQFRSVSPPTALNWDPLKGPGALIEFVKETGAIDAMIMLAGATPRSPNLASLNKNLAEACLESAHLAGIKRILLASSSAVYGTADNGPFSEASECTPITEYGLSKLVMEEACSPWRKIGLEVCCLRIGNVAGADALLTNIEKSGPTEPIYLDTFDNGRGPKRSYIGPLSMSKVLETLCCYKGTLPQLLNLASPTPVEMEQLAIAAGGSIAARRAPLDAYQNLTLDCGLISKLHAFRQRDSQPSEMVRQWRKVS